MSNAPACLCNDRARSGIGLGEGLICVSEGKQSHMLCARCAGPGLTCPLHRQGTVGKAPWLRKLVRTCPDGCVLALNETVASHRCNRRDILFLGTPTSKFDIQMACDFNAGFVKVTSSVSGPILDGRKGFQLGRVELARSGQTPTAIAVKMTQGILWDGKPIEFVRLGVAWPHATFMLFWPALTVDDAMLIKGIPFSITAICHVPFSRSENDTCRAAFGISGYEFGLVSRHPCARKRWSWMGPEQPAASGASTGQIDKTLRSRQPRVFGEKLYVNAPAAYSIASAGSPIVRCSYCGKLDTLDNFQSHGCGAGTKIKS